MLPAIALAVLTSFAKPAEPATDRCWFVFLQATDFVNKTTEISNVFKVAPEYTPDDRRYRFTRYLDSTEAENARRSNIRTVRSGTYQLMLIHRNDECSK